MCLTFYPIWITEFIQIMLNIDNDQDLCCKFSRATMWAFMFASIATLLAITIDRYSYIVKPLRYLQIVTHGRVFLAILGIWITACCFFIVHFIYDEGYHGTGFRSLCDVPTSIYYFTDAFVAYAPLILIFFCSTFTFYLLLKSILSV